MATKDDDQEKKGLTGGQQAGLIALGVAGGVLAALGVAKLASWLFSSSDSDSEPEEEDRDICPHCGTIEPERCNVGHCLNCAGHCPYCHRCGECTGCGNSECNMCYD